MAGLIIPPWIYPLLVWELVWKAIALWPAARNRQLGWYLVCLITNTAGVLPILYVTFFQKSNNKNNTRKKRKIR